MQIQRTERTRPSPPARRALALACSAAVFAAAGLGPMTGDAHANEPIRAYEGSRVAVTDKHLIPNPRKGEGYGEKYTFDGEFGDAGDFYFSLAIANLGIGDNKMEAKGRFTVEGKTFRWNKKLDEGKWSFSKSSLDIKAGPARMHGQPDALQFDVKTKEVELNCTYTPIARAWRPRNGQVHFGKDRKISDYTVFPLSEGACKYKIGEAADWSEVKGRGWGSRSWSDLAVYEQARWTLSLRAISGDYTVYIREMGAADEYGKVRVPYILITKGAEILVESFDYELKPSRVYSDDKHDNKYQVPVEFTLLGQDAEDKERQFRGKVTEKKLRSREDLLKNMNSAVRMIAQRYSKPMKYDYDATFAVQVKIGDRLENISGVGRYEVYHFNP